MLHGVCNLPQYISFWVLLPTLDVMLHTFWVIDGAECAESKQANCPRFDSIPPIHGGGPTFDLSVRSNFPPSSSTPRHSRREQGNSSSQTNETNCISSEQERRRRKKEAKWNYETGYCSGGLQARPPRQLTHMTLHRSLGGPKLNLRN